MEKENQGVLEMIPPLRGVDFQGIAGLSSDDSLLVGVNRATTARERSFKKAPALSNIGSMSPARLSLSTVASPHGRLLFHLAAGILAEHQRRLSGQLRTSVCHHSQRAGSQATVVRFRSGEKYFLDIPLYRSPGSGNSSRTSTKVVRAAQNKRLSSLAEGWKSSNSCSLPVWGEIFS